MRVEIYNFFFFFFFFFFTIYIIFVIKRFKVRYPIYLGKFSENLFQYTHSENIYNDLYHGQYVYYYITQEFSIKDIPNWCHYPLWLIQHYTNGMIYQIYFCSNGYMNIYLF